MYSDDIDYASKRLNNTLVRLETGEPFYISRTMFNGESKIVHMGTNLITSDTVMADHETLNLEPVPLGFINTSHDMVFIMRKPMRRDWHQGLSHNSIATHGPLRSDEVNMKMLIQPITKQYPSFARALASLAKKNSIAFSRDFGLTRKNGQENLIYRKHVVGEVRDGCPVLFPHKFFLQQHLEEVMG